MIRPEQALGNCALWEEQIDTQLRDHNWVRGSDTCVVLLRTTSKLLRPLLDRYREKGWEVEIADVEVVENCTSCHFTMQDSWSDYK